MNSRWIPCIAEVLELNASDIERDALAISFVGLGGTSLRAFELAAIAEERLGCSVDVGELLGPKPLAEVFTAARPVPRPAHPRPVAIGEQRELSAIQTAMLLGEELHGGTAFHLLFSVDIRGPLDSGRLMSALARLTHRHESLRTVFTRESGELRRRVLGSWAPDLIEQSLPLHLSAEPVAAVHTMLEPATAGLLRPFELPPVIFYLTTISNERFVLSVVVHHAVADGWSMGLLWRELVALYEASDDDVGDLSPSIEPLVALETADATRDALRRRIAALAGIPTTVELPSDLTRPAVSTHRGARLLFSLSSEARRGCDELARASGLTRNAVLLATWALVVARRASVPELVMGMVAAGRLDSDAMRVIGPCMKMLPVRCRIAGFDTPRSYLHHVALAMREALKASAVPFEHIVAGLDAGGDRARNPLVQVAFAAHDELVPIRLHTPDLTFDVHEGHCGGTVFDAVLYVQQWEESSHLALEYGTSILRPNEAAELACAIDSTLAELAAALDGPLAEIRSMTAAQRRRLTVLGTGPNVDTESGLWQLIEERAALCPQQIAVRDTDPTRTLTYRQLIRAVEIQSAELATVGVREGDCVALESQRSAREIVAILAILRLGASYTGIEGGMPEPFIRRTLDGAHSRTVLGDGNRLAQLATALDGRTVLSIVDPWRAAELEDEGPPATAPDPSRVAYIAFTSGSTGTPKGTRVLHRGVVRLTRDPTYLRPSACERFVRMAPLGFDASTLEIFAPLMAGGCVEIYPDPHVVPSAFAEFLESRCITGLWLSAGLFRLVADYRPDAFVNLRQVLTGGDVVPPEQVRRVLRACPGLRVTNGYGPTECTTFTTAHHVEDPVQVDDPLPIGRPIQGTGVVVLDETCRMVPPGAIGELYIYGDGLALDYAGLSEETAAAFGRFSPELDERLYRTGDLVRWDTQGHLRFLGRRDRQVKIRGFRIELDGVARTLREYPGIHDAVVVPTVSEAGDRRLIAGVVAPDVPGLRGALREFAAQRLPDFAIPSLWAIVDELPITANGKLDVARLERLAQSRPPAVDPAPDPTATVPNELHDIEGAIAATWGDVLGARGFGGDERFFDVGGDSLQLLRVVASLRRSLAEYEVTLQELRAHPTIRGLALHLLARSPRQRKVAEDRPGGADAMVRSPAE